MEQNKEMERVINHNGGIVRVTATLRQIVGPILGIVTLQKDYHPYSFFG